MSAGQADDGKLAPVVPLRPGADDTAIVPMDLDESAGSVPDPLEMRPAAGAPMTVGEVKIRALRGIAALTGRAVGTRAFTFAGNVILARLLVPKAFGLFAIVNFVVAIASFLADMGIGAALVQRKDELTEEDLQTAFSFGLIIDGIFTLGIVLLAPTLTHLYHLEAEYIRALRVLALTIMVSTFAVIPSIKLERTMRFGKLATADVVSQIGYILIAVGMALAGFHVWALIVAAAVSRVMSTLMLNAAAWWRPRVGMSRSSLRNLLVFGLPYQANGIVTQIKDNFIPTFVALVAGATAVGHLNFAINLAGTPMFAVTVVSRITFATYSRLQHDAEALRKAVEESIRWVSAVVFPVTLLLMALAPEIIHYVYGPKWRPSLPAFYFMCIPVILSTYSTVLVSALYGLGRAKQVLKLTIIWTIAGWGLAVPLTLALGFTGFAVAMAMVSSLSVLTVREINKVLPIRFVRSSLRLFAMAAIPALVVWALAPHLVHDFLSCGLLAIGGGLAYLGLLFVSGEIGEAQRMLKVVMQRA